jgi:NADH:ubiquinone oxidoreductase subunit C
MTREELKEKLTAVDPSLAFDEGGEWLVALVSAADWKKTARYLRDDPAFQFNYLFCLTCVDWKAHLGMVYHLTSTVFRHTVVVKVNLDASAPSIDTVSDLWRTAEFHEREVYELFGVDFKGHPDLRLLILPDGWEGKNPLRKDFEDPVNMIRL